MELLERDHDPPLPTKRSPGQGAESTAADDTQDIIDSSTFVVGVGEAQFVVEGAEVGVINFGYPVGRIWGLYSSLGLGTLTLALGVGATRYIISSAGKIKDVVRGAIDV